MGECLPTFNIFIWLFPSVNYLMDNEFLLPAEGLLTLNTSVEFLTCVTSFFFFCGTRA
jgi:hypothetical protein